MARNSMIDILLQKRICTKPKKMNEPWKEIFDQEKPTMHTELQKIFLRE